MTAINYLIDKSIPLRFERKYWFSLDLKSDLLTKISANAFFQPYPTRQVNSMYLDNSQLSSYHQSINGVYNRHKVRVRWYGNFFQPHVATQLELKYKQGCLGGKNVYPLGNFDITKKSSLIKFWNQLNKKSPKNLRGIIDSLQPKISTIYQRQYWQHSFYPFRLTIDTKLQTINHIGKIGFDKIPTTHPIQIVELKYSSNKNLETIATNVGQFLPLQLNQFSKYTWAIDKS